MEFTHALLIRFSTLCVLLVSLSVSGLTHAAYSGLYSFGDSLSDTGNVFATTHAPVTGVPFFNGDYNNEPVWVDLLGPMLGLASPTASETGGTNYAWGGARTLIDGSVWIINLIRRPR